ncbi:MAG: hypothetical protein M1823_001976 [Watsoniomyces obsoletus]|nr:MAG: hypothetical protein M1823_001976 [Watsoniomyces obsoletus]
MAPSSLSITTSSLQRLVKEFGSYQQEVVDQEKRTERLESKAAGTSQNGTQAEENEDEKLERENAEYELRQSSSEQSPAQTSNRGGHAGDDTSAEVQKAQEALSKAKACLTE